METTALSNTQRDPWSALLEIARDLTASLAAEDRYQRLLSSVRRLIPADAACLLRLEGSALVPLAGHGLADEALVRRYERKEHPRLDVILGSREPVLFPAESGLPDPFDGLLEGDARALSHVHACLGCALTDAGEVVGALTADALEPRAFDGLDRDMLATLGALAGAAMRTTALIEALESRAERSGRVARELERSVAQERGGEILGTSEAVRRLRREIGLVARSDLAVLVTGESGTGKELVARAIHGESARAHEPLIHVNCAALPESIAESELFGHVAGAFTGAVRDRAGKFEVADRGTIFLDEIGELPLTLQPKLLRALQQGEIQRVGSDRVHRVDVRVVAATNRDLEREIESGNFRADLYHRLAAFPIRVPPLRERREDVSLLAAHFADEWRRRLGVGPIRVGDEARAALAAAAWPGNVRELENVIGRGVLRASQGRRDDKQTILIGLEHLDVDGSPGEEPRAGRDTGARPPRGSATIPLRARVIEYQRAQIRAALAAHDGSWAAAARDLGMHRSNLYHLARRLGLDSSIEKNTD